MKTISLLLIFAFMGVFQPDVHSSELNDTNRNSNDTISNSAKAEKPVILNPYHRNLIKLNPTPMLLWGDIRNFTLSYERLFNKNQSVGIQLGYLVLPEFLGDTLVQQFSLSAYSRKGINIAFDYRYYPGLRNRRPAPDGLYLGGYVSYYGFNFSNQLTYVNSPELIGSFEGRLNMLNLGIELGYQFIFWKRLSLDLLLFGPSLSVFFRELKVTGNLDTNEIDEIDQELASELLDRYPFLEYLFKGETATFSGSRMHFGTGFRYCVQIGFHF
jgi:hypothetical protein